VTRLIDRIRVALDNFEGTDVPPGPGPGPVEAHAALGLLVFHVVRSFAQDRKLLASWLEEGARSSG
jgi:hypothetical protein